MSGSYRVVVTPAAEEDIRNLPTPGLRRAAIKLVLALRDDPYLGEELRSRPNIKILDRCRKLRFDDSSRGGRGERRPRYRIVYRNEPEGAPAEIVVLAVAPRESLDAYRRAAKRLGDRGRRKAQ